MPLRVHVNCAITLDGCLGGPGRTPLEISNPEDRHRVQALRARSDAILVGVGTVIQDDPKLNVKWNLLGRRRGPHPLRVVLDPSLRTPRRSRVLDDSAPTLFFAARDAPERDGWAVERVRWTRDGLDLGEALRHLEAAHGVRRLLVEGGQRTLTRFFRQDRVDEATIFVSPRVVGAPDAPRLLEDARDLRRHLRLAKVEKVGDGALLSLRRA